MPGTTMGTAYEMGVEEALAILAVDDSTLLICATADEAVELRRAAAHVVAAHAQEVAARYLPRAESSLKVVK